MTKKKNFLTVLTIIVTMLLSSAITAYGTTDPDNRQELLYNGVLVKSISDNRILITENGKTTELTQIVTPQGTTVRLRDVATNTISFFISNHNDNTLYFSENNKKYSLKSVTDELLAKSTSYPKYKHIHMYYNPLTTY